MYNYLCIILIVSNLFLLTTCLIIHKPRTKDTEEICAENFFRSINTNHLRPCYINNYRDRSIFVWFTIEKSLLNIFQAYRFILRSIDELSLSTINIHILTNFTQLIDSNNSLHILNLDSGQYEVCIDFQSYSTTYIYSPRNGCIFIRRTTELSNGSLKQNSTQLFMAAIIGIILLLLLTIVSQLMKFNRKEKHVESSNENKVKIYEETQQIKSSTTIPVVTSPKKQRNYIVRKLLFRCHTEQSDSNSCLRKWILNRTFRNCMSIEKHETKQSRQTQRRNKPSSMMKKNSFPKTSTSSEQSSTTTNDVYTIPMNKCSRKFSFYLGPLEEFEFI